MFKFIDTKEESIVLKIIESSKAILKLYNELKELEANDRRKSEEYNKILSYLDMALEYEKDLYDSLNLNEIKVSSIYQFLKDRGLNFVLGNIETLFDKDEEDMVNKRIINHMIDSTTFLKKEKFYPLIYSFLLENELISYNILSNDEVIVKKYLEKDVIGGLLSNVQAGINTAKTSTLKNGLIDFKYDLTYMYPYLEQSQLANDFYTNDKQFIGGLETLVGLYGISKVYSESIFNSYIDEKLISQTMWLSSKDNEQLVKDDTLVEASLRGCLIKSLFNLYSSKKSRIVENQFREQFASNPNDELSFSIYYLLNIFKDSLDNPNIIRLKIRG